MSLDNTQFVTASIEEVEHTLVEAFLLVALVVFVFLGSLRTTLIPILAVPVSLVGTFALFVPLGFSINLLTLFGIVLAIGIVVDDAIVVVEAVEANLERGMAPVEATEKAMDEVAGPVVAIALVLCSVFVPVAFAGDHRAALQAIRPHPLGVGGPLGARGADAHPGSVLAVAQASPARHGRRAARLVHRRLQPPVR